MRICPKCKTHYPDSGLATCAVDGATLMGVDAYEAKQNDPLLGKTVADRYRISERIGTGGMGAVYRATQEGLERDVALKILKPELVWDKDTVTRFHREAKAMSLLTHANTVRVYDFGQTPEGLLFFAMELVEGELLTTRLNRGPLEVMDAIRIAQQILRSLHEAHTKGIIHRDLKPDNIFLARVDGHSEPVVKVLDFGIAKMFQPENKIDQLETQAGTVFGTPRYMSPEQAQGHPLDPRSDIYSVGVLAYQMLTGRAPFLDDDAVVVMASHIREKPKPPTRVAPNRPIPNRLERRVLKALEKNREKRFETAEAFDTALERAVPDVLALKEALKTGKLRVTLFGLPRLPLLAALGLVVAALVVSSYLIFSTGSVDASQTDWNMERTDTPQARSTPRQAVGVPVLFETNPPGAEVVHLGLVLGETPHQERFPSGTKVQITLQRRGYVSRTVDVEAGIPVAPVRLEREGGSASMETTQPRAGRPNLGTRPRMGPTPAEMAAPSSMDPYERWD